MYHRVDAKYNVRHRKIENKIQRPLVRYKFFFYLTQCKKTYLHEGKNLLVNYVLQLFFIFIISKNDSWFFKSAVNVMLSVIPGKDLVFPNVSNAYMGINYIHSAIYLFFKTWNYYFCF